MLHARLLVIGPFCVVMLTGAGVAAQSPRRDPPYQDQSGLSSTVTDRSLALRMSAAGGYDGWIAAGRTSLLGTADPRLGTGAGFVDLSGDLRYFQHRSRFDFGAAASGAAQRYRGIVADFITSQNASVDAAIRFGRGTSVTASQTAALQPYYPLGSTARASEAAAPGSGIVRNEDRAGGQRGRIVAGAVVVGSSLGRHTTFGATCDYRSASYTRTSISVHTRGAGAGLTRTLNRSASVRLGYRYQEGRYGSPAGDRAEIHNLDTGVDYSRALSSSRRTTIGFSTGAAMVRSRGERLLRMTGEARLTTAFGRTWAGDLRYRHDIGFVDTLPAPVSSDAVVAGAGGRLGQRLMFRAAAGYTSGVAGLTARSSPFNLYDATATLTSAVSRHISVSVETFYYRYSFASSSALLPPGWPRRLNRPGIRAQITTSLPLVERTRRNDAGR